MTAMRNHGAPYQNQLEKEQGGLDAKAPRETSEFEDSEPSRLAHPTQLMSTTESTTDQLMSTTESTTDAWATTPKQTQTRAQTPKPAQTPIEVTHQAP